MKTEAQVFLLQVVSKDRLNTMHITGRAGRQVILTTTAFSFVIRPPYLMQHLIIKEFGGQLSFFTSRQRS
ncbi:MAG: hypothetical protein GTO29_14385 [Candidatus Latescibacteria bacterium]|nr:hypothetical protein [Candidatus Latescibacterota bacterium]NIO57334.1 hypothetical protein [Candidatus Latescibacterota bacterium]